MMTPSLSPDQPSQNLEKWEDKHVRLLIECYLKYKDQLGKATADEEKSVRENCRRIQSYFGCCC